MSPEAVRVEDEAMKRPDVQLSLWIDGTAVSVGSVNFLFQRAPLPGGHRYRFEIQGADAARALGKLPLGRRERLEQREASDLMEELDWLIAKVADVPRHGGYFLNTVDRLAVDAAAVVVEGRCSAALG
jgi:hypothetical protein